MSAAGTRTGRFTAVAAAGTVIVLAVPGTAHAAGGELDPTWGDGGSTVIAAPIGPEYPFTGSSRLARARDGGAYVGVDLNSLEHPRAANVLRLDAGGERVLDYAGDGRLVPYEAQILAGELETDIHDVDEVGSSLIVTGTTGRPGDVFDKPVLFVQRYDRDGEHDVSYGEDGAFRLRLGGEAAWVTKVQTGGTAITCATGGERRLRVVKLTADGLGAPEFGTDGVAAVQNSRKVKLVDCMATADGGVLVLQRGGYRTMLTKITSDGTIDETFGVAGEIVVRTPTFGPGKHGRLLADGGAVVLGTVGGTAWRSPAVLRLTPDGALDPAFGDEGIAVMPTPEQVDSFGFSGLVVDGKGRVLFAGSRTLPSGFDRFLARMRADGSMDPTYGTEGVVTYEWDEPSPYVLDVYPDGRLLAIAYDEHDLVVQRLLR